jgi:hypothetical protein
MKASLAHEAHSKSNRNVKPKANPEAKLRGHANAMKLGFHRALAT